MNAYWKRSGVLSTLLVLTWVFALALGPSSAQECDVRCRTRNCDGDGTCICDLPDPSTILNGDRKYFGGQFCDEERTMCDGSDKFWCGNGAACNELVQGENYTCVCSSGYSGEHCEVPGFPCGDSFCYHQGECLQTEILCECPPNWRGSEDCSLPTEKRTNNQIDTGSQRVGKTDEDNLYAPVFYIVVGVIMVILIVFVGRKLYKKRSERGMQLRNLRQVQMGGLLDDDDDDDDDAFAHKPLANGDF